MDPPALTIEFAGGVIGYDERVLAPRPWTEAQSRWARELVSDGSPVRVLELCAGAGHIGLAAVQRTSHELVQVDRNPVACAWAQVNATVWGIDVDVRCASMADAFAPGETFGLILADPPWVPTDLVDRFPGDPREAIDGGADGLDIAIDCVEVIADRLTPGGHAIIQLGNVEQVRQLESFAAARHLRIVEARPYTSGALAHLQRADQEGTS